MFAEVGNKVDLNLFQALNQESSQKQAQKGCERGGYPIFTSKNQSKNGFRDGQKVPILVTEFHRKMGFRLRARKKWRFVIGYVKREPEVYMAIFVLRLLLARAADRAAAIIIVNSSARGVGNSGTADWTLTVPYMPYPMCPGRVHT